MLLRRRKKLNGQFLTPLAPTRGNDPATTGSAHSLTEAVRLSSLAAVRLISALQNNSLVYLWW